MDLSDSYDCLGVDIEDGVVTIELQRPEVHNALDTATMLDLSRVFDEIELDRSVDVVVVTGAGDAAFSAGADIEQYAGPAEAHDPVQRDRQARFFEMYRSVYDCHAPVIAKIEGYCLGGGLILAMYCDLRIATEGSRFGVPTANIGQIPTGGSTYRAIELVGEAKAKELVFTAGQIDAVEAHRIGLINRLVEPEAIDGEVNGVVEAIRSTGRTAVKASKRALNHAAGCSDLETARAFEAELWWDQFTSEERRRRVDEFVDH